MKRINFNMGDKVVTVKDGELRKGVIKNVYPVNPPVVAVKFEDGTVEKVFQSDIALEPDIETPDETNEPAEKPEITITPDKFRDISCRVIAEEIKSNLLLAVAFSSIMSKIHNALFVEPWEND